MPEGVNLCAGLIRHAKRRSPGSDMGDLQLRDCGFRAALLCVPG
jgi:hypothetical protein